MAAPFEMLAAILVAVALLPLTASTFAYAFVEQRHRGAWTRIPASAHLGAGPYRRVELPVVRFRRAPLLVRAAALTCFYWSWVSVGVWVAVGVASRGIPELELGVLAGLLVAVATWRAGGKLLRRDARAVVFCRRVAFATTLCVAATSALAILLGGLDVGGLVLVLGGVTIGQALLMVAALKRHGELFMAPEKPLDRLPAWLARLLSSRRRLRQVA